MNVPNYFIEFDGTDYLVLMGARVIAAFGSIDEAFNAKRSFEEKPRLNEIDKTPPAMRLAKSVYHG